MPMSAGGPASIGPRNPRLYIVELDLAYLSGHFFDQALGFLKAGHSAGMNALVLAPKDLEPSLAEALDARTILERPLDLCDRDALLDALTDEQKRLAPLWAFLAAQELTGNDVIVFTSARAFAIHAATNWLAVAPPDARPAVFFRFFGPEFLDPRSMTYNDSAWLYRFVSRELSLRPGQERCFFTINNDRLVEKLARLCGRRVFHMPVPKYHGSDLDLAVPRAQARTVIYVHLNMRSGVFLEQIGEIVRIVSAHRSDLEFLVKVTLNAREAARSWLDEGAIDHVTLVPTEQSARDFLSTIASSEIVVLPYDSADYRAIASGVFCEAAGQGKVIVAPDDTWMADQIAQHRAAGILFAEPTAPSVGAAILAALENLPRLAIEARQKREYFQHEHSCGKVLELMLRLARAARDQSPVYLPGSAIDFRSKFDSRCYLGAGWSVTEPDHGVWSDGPVAELVFHLEPKPSGPLLLRVHLSAFVDTAHPGSRVDIFANGVDLARWTFSIAQAEQAHRAWREATIPAEVACNDELRIELRIADPASPRELGISIDPRRLGIMLHELSISAQPATLDQ